MNVTRRIFTIAAPMSYASYLMGCTSLSGALTPAQVVADLSGILPVIQGVEAAVVKAAPNALGTTKSTIDTVLADAANALGGLTTTLPASTGASKADQIDGWINVAMNDITEVAGFIPSLAPIVLPLTMVEAILPEVEAFINQYLPASMTTPPPAVALRFAARRTAKRLGLARAISPATGLPMTADEARAALGIPIVHA